MQNKRTRILTCAVLCTLLILSSMLGASATASNGIKLYPGGMPFGVKFSTDGVLIVGFSDITTSNGKASPAYDAGLRAGDIITSINGKKIEGVDSVVREIERNGAGVLDITFTRDGKEQKASFSPVLCVEDGKYKTGMWIRDSGAGIGTVTYIDPETLSFAGLGHGICDIDTGALMPISHGSVTGVILSGISKGSIGAPGELKGHFDSKRLGELFRNSECGVFGKLFALPDTLGEEPLPIATHDEVKPGEAHILCTISGNDIKKYDIEITAINKRDTNTKNFSIKVTDPALIEASGGIVQGMSGSPIIQNGKLIGAVTHVMINDPTEGYGIFIENMLEAAK